MVATVEVSFCNEISVFVEVLLVDFGMNNVVILPIEEAFVITSLRVMTG